ncbi:FAD-dependent oxidoreductase [Amycolatopsis sp. PS_44_ISF1]|uniref:FAD-dependent oxidoreductase n=1 Tax=Amycolatopsis sp. PS_44_ISF1 TaxID=2974917 RepID=UPI0028DE075D|nr:FAD-dependent oxidoreductase [Amycolatopsis sp. PS_44_ISF1]MDT8914052.1 FAD-binding oxidoreductase [Amycolatopsis sp. PS_44_ISF1]
MRVTVVGGGIAGLCCAHRLAEAGHRVTVRTAGKPGESTSAVAGGLIYPPMETGDGRVARWTAVGLEVYRNSPAAPGIRFRPGSITFAEDRPGPPWLSAMTDVTREGGRLGFTTALVDMPVYLGWLAEQVAALGVRTEYAGVASLASLAEGDADVVVNAAGLAGGTLAGDDALVPVRGQVVHLADPGLTSWTVAEEDDELTYVFPHGRHVVCGGTEEIGRGDLDPDPAAASAIVRRCRALVPELAEAPVLGTRVGLRPGRPSVRLERVGNVVHDYGHGGAGVTLAWGCAEDVVGLL